MRFDLIVLGGGSGGIAAAVRAARYGARVAVVEQAHLGGTCVNLGCVPKKIMFNAAMTADIMANAPGYGFEAVDVQLDWPTLVSRREAYIERLRGNYSKRFEEYGITHVSGRGSFVDAHTIDIAGTRYQADHIIIATGGEPASPSYLPGMEHAITSDGFFALNKRPDKVAIIGGGYIAVELAGMLHSLGSETHLIMRGERPLRHFDELLGNTLMAIMTQQGLRVHSNHKVQGIRLDDYGKKIIRCESDVLFSGFDTVIVAIGRKPRTKGLNLEAIGVAVDVQGLIRIDAYQNTSVEGVYALGDVTQAPALTPVAIAAGRRLSDRIFGKQPDAHLDRNNICSVVFSHPPIGTVGLSEEGAITQYGKQHIKVYQTRFNPMFDAFNNTRIPTAMKLVTFGEEERIVGLHVIGYAADEMLQGFGVAIKMGACKRDFDNTIAIHPTSAEELVTML